MAPFFSFASFGGGIASKLLGGGSDGFSATGGTQFEPGNGYQYIIFTAPGTLTVENAGPGLVDLLVVAGGGGGGGAASDPGSVQYAGGGGGAGGYSEHTSFSLPVGTYDISIGPGGYGGPSTELAPGYTRNGGPGTPSHIVGPGITSITAYGGGHGGGSYKNPSSRNAAPGGNGGSGGGATGPRSAGTGNKITGTSTDIPAPLGPQGYPGGTHATFTGIAGGGGGASAAGLGYPTGYNGGDGRPAWSGDDGIPSSYGTPGPSPGRYFAGGGGGGNNNPSPTSVTGGAGGGGAGADDYGNGTGGTANTGGGGGGAVDATGGSGGSGIIIIRAPA